ncbi:hypothetical protein [Streptomyces sp. CBMA123]|uniref:hypothetical protein n=1 Tax=Streptomyces sp. CBMA123 TaxID=1896313 RepID=UPI001661AA2A|nr:hypothetical protein [Streptomyces sp. CBMA123]MBD0690484.1 hypothetical protein [Streptomyces sp. CBMA123]
MTDKFPRPGGGDGDGPAETPTERLLREAMNARTSLITAHDLRPADPPKGRLRRLRPLYLTTVPILALAAAAAIGVVTLHGNPVADHTTPPPPAASITASPSPTATPSGSPSASPTADATPTEDAETDAPLSDATPTTQTSSSAPAGAATSSTLRGVKFKVPAGWKAVPVSADRVCVLSPGAPTDPQQDWTQSRCEPYGVLVVAYNSPDELAAGGLWPTTADLTADAGWGHQPNCPIWGRPYIPDGPYSSVGAPVRTKPTVAGKTIDKTQWNVTCKPGDTFGAQLWGMSSDQVFVVANGLKSDYQPGLTSIVNSLDVSGHKAPSPGPSSADQAAKDIAITVDGGIGAGQKVSANGTPVTFTVTYRNTGQKTYPQLQPLVYTKWYAGTPPSDMLEMNAGKLERQDGGGWVQIPLSQGGGMDYAMVNPKARFSLAPGESKAVTYRMALDPADGPGAMPVAVQVTLPYDGTVPLTVLKDQPVSVTVVK